MSRHKKNHKKEALEELGIKLNYLNGFDPISLDGAYGERSRKSKRSANKKQILKDQLKLVELFIGDVLAIDKGITAYVVRLYRIKANQQNIPLENILKIDPSIHLEYLELSRSLGLFELYLYGVSVKKQLKNELSIGSRKRKRK